MEISNRENFETMILNLIHDEWSEDLEQDLKSGLMVQTLNPTCSLPKELKVESLIENIGEASNIRSDAEATGNEYAADQLVTLIAVIMKDLNESFVL